jgi:hypothetical protein
MLSHMIERILRRGKWMDRSQLTKKTKKDHNRKAHLTDDGHLLPHVSLSVSFDRNTHVTAKNVTCNSFASMILNSQIGEVH